MAWEAIVGAVIAVAGALVALGVMRSQLSDHRERLFALERWRRTLHEETLPAHLDRMHKELHDLQLCLARLSRDVAHLAGRRSEETDPGH